MKKLNFLIIGLLTVTVFMSSKCNKSQTDEHADCTHVHWKYEGNEGPESWADLCGGFSSCDGTVQSPINITGATDDATLSAIDFNYATTKINIVNNGHTIQFNCDEGSTITIGEIEYQLLQFHYHALSEHQVEGKHSPLEVHFVHKAAEDDYAVIGVLIAEGQDNSLFTKYLLHFPTHEGQYTDTLSSIDLSELFPANKSYYHYDGSLTTPPCSEVVNWYVLKNSVTAAPHQVSKMSDILHKNYRPVQPLNGRTISSFNQ